jgi:hypothetical protein
MANADFVLTSGVLGAASLRVGVRQLLPRGPRWKGKVTDEEAAAFVASHSPAPHQAHNTVTATADAPHDRSGRRSPVTVSH